MDNKLRDLINDHQNVVINMLKNPNDMFQIKSKFTNLQINWTSNIIMNKVQVYMVYYYQLWFFNSIFNIIIFGIIEDIEDKYVIGLKKDKTADKRS